MKLLSVLGALAFVFALSSCNQDLMETTYTPVNNDVTFAVPSAKFSLEGQNLVVVLQRGVANEELSVNLTLNDPHGVYTLNTKTVTFAKDEYKKEVSLSYDVNTLKPVVDYNFAISFNEADKALAGYNVFSASAQMPLEYEEYGKVLLRGDYLGNGIECPLYLAKFTNNYYMIGNVADSGVDFEFNIVDGSLNITAPSFIGISGLANKLIRFPSPTVDVGVGPVTFLFDCDPAYIGLLLDENGLYSTGSIIQFDAVYNMGGKYYGWYTCQFVCQ